MILLILPAANYYESQDRVAGWKHTPTGRKSLKVLREMVPRLRELGPTQVVGSDLDHESVFLLSRLLKVPYQEWAGLRRLNAGVQHGMRRDQFDLLLREMECKWNANPDIPLKGGDSRTSFTKRMSHSKERLSKMEGTVVLVVPADVARELTGARAERGRVYQWLA